MDTTSYAVLLSIAVFVNIGVWFIEQLAEIDFEFLSVSYIISELFLLSAHNVMNENRRLRERILQAEKEKHSRAETAASEKMMETPLAEESIDPGRIEAFRKGLEKLTPTERIIYDAYAARVTSKEIMASLNIKENTLKYHNRNIYGKLCINSRKELLEMHKYLKLTDPISQK
jgi:DNA-binding CsgD family transcriptional regulator